MREVMVLCGDSQHMLTCCACMRVHAGSFGERYSRTPRRLCQVQQQGERACLFARPRPTSLVNRAHCCCSRTLLSVSMQLPSACGGLACVFRGVCLTQRWAGELQLPLHQFTVDVDPSGSGLADALHSAARMLEWAHEDGDVSLRLSL